MGETALMASHELTTLLDTRWPALRVASSEQLRVAGLDSRALAAAVRDRILVRIRRGVYVRRPLWQSLAPWERDQLRVEAHWLATGGSSVYSHVSAARLLGCSTWESGPAIHVTVPYSVSRASHGGDVAPHRFAVGDDDVVEVPLGWGQIARATSLDRTVADCARSLDIERAAVVGDHALRLGASLDGIRAAADRTGAIRGARRVERLVGLLDGRSESPGETRTRLALLAAGLPAPELQFEISTGEGRFRADFAWPDVLVILEFDGEAKYFDYRPTDVALRAERRRENAIVDEGWTLVRARWADLSIPGAIPAKVLAAFERARRLAGSRPPGLRGSMTVG
ncbi:type IV toxin-antitoxin system AbiEi family antitoxin domain-containing protein [Sinomonas sp. ASV322]|uniref:type IV toxin-antitoxin system AbiEi family antitoxin domain-containing protein n=1 Tax=Sinomonas sp. ASV322 TaxID=3041920 RepID=UPI0027DDF024|nr:type IV toxin-antitoxin system AbiEi family antitoxin domain-containing protein [Sinomonas sp. ASV322]MDQ4501702.1 type IV toxin-antitoxin system AbiEi family antitoxin domain-containing protein [Sinomonas sp. ASV322]